MSKTFEQQAHVDSLLAQWVANSLCPTNVLQDPAFARFLEYVSFTSGRFYAPSSEKIKLLIEDKAARLRTTLGNKISKDCEFFSVSSEIWPSLTADSYMTITLHYVSETFDISSWTLDVVNLPIKHDDKMVERALREVFTKWQLPMEKCTGFLQKSGQNIPKFLGLKSLPCIAHSLNLIAGSVLLQRKEDVLEEDWMFEGNKKDVFNGKNVGVKASEKELDSLWTEIDTLVASSSASCDELATVRCVVRRFRKLAMFFLRSQKGDARLKRFKDIEYRRFGKVDVVMDCSNWRSTMMMLSHLIKLQPVLNTFFEYLHSDAGVEEFSELTRTMLYIPTEEDWFTIKCLKELFGHFSAFAREMQRSKYSSLALALPGIRALRAMLLDKEMFDPVLDLVQEEELKSRLRDMMLSVSRSFTKLLDTSFEGLNAEMSWISLLDPRFTDTKLLTAAEKRQGEERLVAEMLETAKAARVSTSDTTEALDLIPIKEDPERPNKKRRTAYWEQLYGGRSAAQETAADTDSVLLEECKWEFSKYLRDSAVAEDTVEPLKWWKENRTDFPKLAPLARKWLGCIATSVPTKQAFSTSSTMNLRRSTLESDTVGDILFIAENNVIY